MWFVFVAEYYCILCELRNVEEETVDDLQVATTMDFSVWGTTWDRIKNLQSQ